MAARSHFRTQHVMQAPSGWSVRSKRAGEHVVRIAFPPGRRRKGSGKVIEVLHPKKNAACEEGSCTAQQNPTELLIFGNPQRAASTGRRNTASSRRRRRNAGTANHQPGCACFACKYKRGESPRRITRSNKKRARACRTKVRASGKHARVGWTPKPRKRNPEEETTAVQLRESFTGEEAGGIVNRQVSDTVRLLYVKLGDLHSLTVSGDKTKDAQIIFEGDGVSLCAAPPAPGSTKSTQLYAIGGNQNIANVLRQFVDDPTKDFIDLGECSEVVYDARKIHDNFAPVEYHHEFGEGNRPLPHIAYNTLHKAIYFIGGAYFIETKAGVSPGIEG